MREHQRDRNDPIEPLDADPRSDAPIVRDGIEPLALRARDAARALGVSERALWALTNRGDVPCVRVGRTITYPVESLREWLRRRAKAGNRPASRGRADSGGE